MNKKIEFKQFDQSLDDGFQIFFTYVRNRYLIFKTNENCYTLKLLSEDPKNPQPRNSIITHKRVKEMFSFMEDMEFKAHE